MVSQLIRKLSSYKPSALFPEERMCASVLIPIFESGSGPRILLTKRTNKVKYHKGEVSFPGGMYEEKDGDTLETAIRECSEEIGVRGSDITIVGRLDDMSTFTGFVITPYVGLIPFPYDFKLNPDEVAYLIYLPMSHLLNCEPHMETYSSRGGSAPALYYEGERIWGATCRILLQLRKIVEDGTAPS